ncbi:MAG TPA: hypothetical protein DEP23_11975 [Ruminococcaceae bacterium]|nr:hypothetical protein [Oscillospiraceae bacterium]
MFGCGHCKRNTRMGCGNWNVFRDELIQRCGNNSIRKIDCVREGRSYMMPKKDGHNKNSRIDSVIGKIHGTFATQAVTDTTDRFEETNVARPSDENVKEGREWVNYNKK